MATRIGTLLIVLALVGLNVYQFATRPDAVAAQPAHATPPATVPVFPKSVADFDPYPPVSPLDKWAIERVYHLYYDPKVWMGATWLGVTCLQNPNDLWIHQEIMVETKPDFVIECGTHRGGSALLWAMILEHVNPDGRIITIDIKDSVKEAREHPLWRRRVDHLIGSSTDPAIVAEVAQRVRGKKVLVILDSDHNKQHVLAEIKAYAPLVQVGGYLIVQDTVVHGHPVFPTHPPGPMEAVLEFLAENKEFESDRTRERYILTFHPKGYLKRIR